MPTTIPKFLRLTEAASRGMAVHVDSGWGISGFDVRQAPDQAEYPGVSKWVRNMMAQGVIEGASQAEWDEVHEADLEQEEIPTVRMVTAGQPLPENKVRERLNKQGATLAKRRASRLEAEYDVDREEAEDEDDNFADNTDGEGRAGDAQTPSARERRDVVRKAEGKGKAKKVSAKTRKQAAAQLAAESEDEDDSDEGNDEG